MKKNLTKLKYMIFYHYTQYLTFLCKQDNSFWEGFEGNARIFWNQNSFTRICITKEKPRGVSVHPDLLRLG